MTDQPAPEAWRTDPRERLLAAIDSTWAYSELGTTPEQLVDDFAHHLAEQIRATASADDGPATKWNWWDAATIPDSCADLIDPKARRV